MGVCMNKSYCERLVSESHIHASIIKEYLKDVSVKVEYSADKKVWEVAECMPHWHKSLYYRIVQV
jgi:hypothetical protein